MPLEEITVLIAAVGVLWGGWQLRQAARHRKLELGSLYIQRYWEIDDDLLTLEKGSLGHRHARHRYLRLCEDEFEAAKRKWLEKGQWEAWHEWLVEEPQRAILIADLEECDPLEGRFVYLRQCLASELGHDWGSCKAKG